MPDRSQVVIKSITKLSTNRFIFRNIILIFCQKEEKKKKKKGKRNK